MQFNIYMNYIFILLLDEVVSQLETLDPKHVLADWLQLD